MQAEFFDDSSQEHRRKNPKDFLAGPREMLFFERQRVAGVNFFNVFCPGVVN